MRLLWSLLVFLVVFANAAYCAESKLSDAMKNGTQFRNGQNGGNNNNNANNNNNNKNQNNNNNNNQNGFGGEEINLKNEVRRYLRECGSEGGSDDNFEQSYYGKNGWGGSNGHNRKNSNNNNNNRNREEEENSSDYYNRGSGNNNNNNNNNKRNGFGNNRYNNNNENGGDECNPNNNHRNGFQNGFNNQNHRNNRYSSATTVYGGGSERYSPNHQNYDAYGGYDHRHGANCDHNNHRGADGFGMPNYGNNRGGYGNNGNNNNNNHQNGYGQQDYGGYGGGQNGYGNPTTSNGFFGSSSYDRNNNDHNDRYSFFRARRSSDDAQCVSQCVFGYLEVLDDNRVPSETLLIKWLQDHMTGDVKRIRALREARRCFARLATSGTDDGCEFSKSLSNCLNLEIE